MKKYLALLMAAMLLLPSCGRSPAPSTSDVASAQSSAGAASESPDHQASSASDSSAEDNGTPEGIDGYVSFQDSLSQLYPRLDPLYRTDGVRDTEYYCGNEDLLRGDFAYPPSVQDLYAGLPPKEFINLPDGSTVLWYAVDDEHPGYEVPLSAFHYEKNADGTSCTITKIDNLAGSRILVIPAAIDGLIVTGIGERVCAECSLEVVEACRVTDIGKGAFANCRSLYHVNFSGDIIVGDYAFFQCISLADFPFYAVTSIGECAFKNCISLTSVKAYINLKHLGVGAFAGCTGISSVWLGGGEVRSDGKCVIPSLTFTNCHSLTSVAILGNVDVVEYAAFAFCYLDGSISCYFGEGVQEVGFLDIVPAECHYFSAKLPSTLKKLHPGRITELFYAGSTEKFQKVKLDQPLSGGAQVYFDYVDPYNWAAAD